MDYKKDIQQMGIASRRNSSGIESFSITLSKKCERLATAIYLITNFLSDIEPMKYRLRTLSLNFVRDASIIKKGSSTIEINVFDLLRGNIGETLALLELAFIAGLVSEMNFTILKREYVSLRDTIDIKKTSRESHTDTILGDNFFASSESTFDPQGRTLNPQKGASFIPRVSKAVASPKGHSIGQTTNTMSDRSTKGHTPASSVFVSEAKQSSTLAPIPHFPFPIHHSVSIESRRTRILKLIKDNREVAIKDIVTHFPDLSEKTIQRELVAMSGSGVLKKFGERRWSRYSLA